MQKKRLLASVCFFSTFESSSMIIKTGPIQFTKLSYVNLIFRVLLGRRWWLTHIFLAAGFFLLTRNISSLAGIFAISFAILRPLLSWISYWKFATDPHNQIIFERLWYEFDDEFITTKLDDGTNSQTRYELIVKVTKTNAFFLLYISAIQFFYIPLNAFDSEEELLAFESLLKDQLRIPLPF